VTAVATEQRWAPKAGGLSWLVVALSPDGTIALTGPGPCRLMKYISIDELEEKFKLVSKSSK